MVMLLAYGESFQDPRNHCVAEHKLAKSLCAHFANADFDVHLRGANKSSHAPGIVPQTSTDKSLSVESFCSRQEVA